MTAVGDERTSPGHPKATLRPALIGALLSSLVTFGLARAFPAEPTTTMIEWTGDNYGVVNLHRDRCRYSDISDG